MSIRRMLLLCTEQIIVPQKHRINTGCQTQFLPGCNCLIQSCLKISPITNTDGHGDALGRFLKSSLLVPSPNNNISMVLQESWRLDTQPKHQGGNDVIFS
uniref:Uncharacterized protein n=1 Tax=Proboscia inermis TaxID=420281 RepID=A0A7S0C1F4_9STRA|mmetsp:Transcript_21372/g.21704  ORF Transcript_21372/g.21704 Transcript_21372/m.21704 type:complete len:100 (+) Transcript_21372:269-568(+)